MADLVTTQTIADTSGVKFVTKMTNFSDGTGETQVKKIDASEVTFMSEDGNRKIAKIWYSINTANNKSAVELIWDGATNATAMLLSGNGYFDLRTAGNEIINNATTPTGDILLSTRNFADGETVSIETLQAKGYGTNASNKAGVKVLAYGELSKKLTLQVAAISKSAQAKVEAAIDNIVTGNKRVVHYQMDMKERRGQDSPDIKNMKFRSNH